MIGITWNCMQEDIRPYHYKVQWLDIFKPWTKCPYPEVRLQCLFILGWLLFVDTVSIPGADSSCITLDENDMQLLLKLLDSAVNSPQMVVEKFDFEFSVTELIIGFQCISSNPSNMAMITKSNLPSLISDIMPKIDAKGMIEVCKLIWCLIDSSSSNYRINSFILEFVKSLEQDDNPDLKVLSTSLNVASRTKSIMEVEMIGMYVWY